MPIVFKIPEMKVSMFNNINPGDLVQVWFTVVDVVGDNVHLAGGITIGRESITGHKPKARTPDEVWASWTNEQKNEAVMKMLGFPE